MIIRPSMNIRPFLLVEHVGFRYLAVIQNGMQIGALAQTPDGRYVQVNGAVVQPLSVYKVLRALRRQPHRKDKCCNPSLPIAAPVVSVRRRRVPAEAPLG